MRAPQMIAAALLLVGTPAVACTGPSVSISGDFQSGEKGWGEPDAQFKLEGAQAIFTPQAATQSARWNAGVTVEDFDACVTISLPDTVADPSRSYAGVLFWVTDKDNFYQAVVSATGMFSVARKAGGKILPLAPVSWTASKAIKTGSGEQNALRLTVEDQTVTLHINDQQVARFRGQAPAAPSHVGLVASSAPSAVDTWRFADLKVTNPPSADAVEAAAAANATDTASAEVTGAVEKASADGTCGAGAVLFDDAFIDHDPAWGVKTKHMTIDNGSAVFRPAVGTPALRFNRVFVFNDFDACATVAINNNTANPTVSYAGLTFWVQDAQNYYQAVLAPNGYFTVARIVDGKALPKRPVDWKKLDWAQTGSKKSNTLRVAAKGGDVEVFVNGKSAGTFRGDPPSAPSYIGLLASAAETKNGDTWLISDLKVTAPQ